MAGSLRIGAHRVFLTYKTMHGSEFSKEFYTRLKRAVKKTGHQRENRKQISLLIQYNAGSWIKAKSWKIQNGWFRFQYLTDNKFIVYYFTSSVSILTDALESIVNVMAVLSGCIVYTFLHCREISTTLTDMAKPILICRHRRNHDRHCRHCYPV